MLTAFLAVALFTAAPDPCAALEPGRTITARLVTARQTPGGGDTLTVTVCVVPQRGSAPLKIGSYHGELHFDSTATVVRVDKPEGGGGVRVENATIAGQVNFAGAAPTGFPGRALVSVVLKLKGATARPMLRLQLMELNTTDGQQLSQNVVVEGAP